MSFLFPKRSVVQSSPPRPLRHANETQNRATPPASSSPPPVRGPTWARRQSLNGSFVLVRSKKLWRERRWFRMRLGLATDNFLFVYFPTLVLGVKEGGLIHRALWLCPPPTKPPCVDRTAHRHPKHSREEKQRKPKSFSLPEGTPFDFGGGVLRYERPTFRGFALVRKT